MEHKEHTEGFKLNTPMAIIVAGVLIAIAIIVIGGKSSKKEEIKDNGALNNAAVTTTKNLEVTKEHYLGNPDAKIKMIVYSDTECPFCKVFNATTQKIAATYKDDVVIIFRHFPLDSLHTKARKEAEATECANELGGNAKFWEYLDKIYEVTPSNDGLDAKLLPMIAENIGLDKAAFETCLNSGKYAPTVQAMQDQGIKDGVQGTPHSLIISLDGTKQDISGAQPFESIKAKLDLLIK